MVVQKSQFQDILNELKKQNPLSLDTETTGLRPYHEDRLFSIAIAAFDETYYFNFLSYPSVPSEQTLLPEHLSAFKELFRMEDKIWFLHNAKFDLAFLAREGLEISGTIHDTQVAERLIFNDHKPGGYDLESCAARIHLSKDKHVDDYIEKNKLWSYREINGEKVKVKHFDQVPFDIISRYAEADAQITHRLGVHQTQAIKKISYDNAKYIPSLPTLFSVLENERRLTRTVFKMEKVGVKIDRPYCVRAARYEADRAEKSTLEFKRLTGKDFVSSGKTFETVFESCKHQWSKTAKGNPSFDSAALAKIDHPAAKVVLDYRDAKSRCDYYQGFLYHADRDDIIHPSFNQSGTATGRFSSSNPNFQNLTAEEGEDLKQEFVIRRAIIPRDGYTLYGRDYKQMEYMLLFDYAARNFRGESEIVRKIKYDGLDPHQATADLVTDRGGTLSRQRAKNCNFAILYGSGYDTLAKTIGSTREEAVYLKRTIQSVCPELTALVDNIQKLSTERRFIINWAGRISHLTDVNFAYKMLNYLIQGGCADVVKMAMNRIDNYLLNKKSRLIMTIHDELVIELHESEEKEVQEQVRLIMDTVFIGRHLTLTTTGYMGRNLADVVECA